ncbi:MAG: hypothetical protein AAGC67_07555 [Myxococcota bacterium]
MMRRLHPILCCLGLVLALLARAEPARAQVTVPFAIDPARSSIEYDSGDFLTGVGLSTFSFATVFAQSGTSTSPLVGHFIVQASPDLSSPSSVRIVRGASEVRTLSGNVVSPAIGGGPGVSAAAMGIELEDPSVDLEAEVAIRDLVFAISSNLSVFANSAGPNGLLGSMAWEHAQGEWDVSTNTGFQSTVLAGFVSSLGGSVSSSTSQVEEVSAGVFEMTLPFSFTLSPLSVPGPFSDVGTTMTFRGEIVATSQVPEPGFAGTAGLGAFALLAEGRRRARR